jgi:hypothetical protein
MEQVTGTSRITGTENFSGYMQRTIVHLLNCKETERSAASILSRLLTGSENAAMKFAYSSAAYLCTRSVHDLRDEITHQKSILRFCDFHKH